MTTVLYIYQGVFPWDVRVEKMCLALKKAGARVVLLSRWKEGLPERDSFKGIEIVRVGKGFPGAFSVPLSYNPLWVSALKNTVGEIKPDLIMPREIMLAESAALIARKRNIPVVMDMAEHYPAAMRGWKKYSRNLALRLFVHTLRMPDVVEKRSVGLCDGIITVCREQNERLHREYGYAENAFQVVHNTPDLEWFSDVKKGGSRPPRVFAHHGFMTEVRNLHTLSYAFAEVAEELDASLVFAGTGEIEPELKEIFKKAGISNRVSFTGPYNHKELQKLYSETDIALIPYHVDELISHTLPNKLFDYMACGKPVITSMAPTMKRVVEETQAGIAVDCTNIGSLASAMMNLSEMNLDVMAANGIHASETKYNWKIDSKNMTDFLKKYISF